MAEKALEINNLRVGYNEAEVVKDISVVLYSEERIGIFGPNGHGKTTLLKTISGLLVPWDGSILYNGESIVGQSPKTIVEKGIIHVSQGNTLFPRMTVLENLHFGAYPKRAWAKRHDRIGQVFELFPVLTERQRQLCRTLSGGERQMLALGMALMSDAKLLMLDEPTLGLAPKVRDSLSQVIKKITTDGMPLILVEQDVDFMLELTDRVYLLEGGKIALESTPSEVDDNEVLSMYFGSDNKRG